MKILALSREAVEDFVANHRDRKLAVISITDPKSKLAKIRDLPILRLQFHDIEKNYPISSECGIKFTTLMAEEIIGFVDRIKDISEILVIHCEAGISRSAATAAAISRILNLDVSRYFKYPYIPNKLVYQTIMKCHLGTDKDVDMPIVEPLVNKLPDDYFGV